MKTSVWMAAAAVMSLSTFGCTPSPEKVCDHMFSLLEAEKGKDTAKSSDDEKKKKRMEKCVSDLNAEKEKDADSYKCGSKCIVAAKKFEEVMKCEDTCPGMKKKGGGGGGSSSKDDDKTEKADKGSDKKKDKDE